jgi:predicted metalloprotease with PDZ domain
MFKSLFGLIVLFSLSSLAMQAQNVYRYNVDLKNIKNDQLHIELIPPKITLSEIIFYMPRIIPGTYRNADYGKFVHNLKALDKSGKALPVKQISTNSWQIKNASSLSRMSYDVEDTWESEIPHDIYDMSGTNIEANKNVVLNTPGFFGFFNGLTKVPFELTITKPENFYASTPLIAKKSDKDSDVFLLNDADHLYDSPIMYSVPDTTSIHLGKTKVLISVYSPKKVITSQAIAELLKELLAATQNYLGGKLPVEKYAFIFYFNGEQAPLVRTGALEHNYSSFYALPEIPFEQISPILLDISAHEFFHIVTPLTISSKEVKDFNFNEPVMSRHLWLYEGSTEYAAHHVQVVEGLSTPEEFLQELTEKISTSKNDFNDALPFTELSLHSTDKYHGQYNNVYQKGALISACLDIYLLKLSKGNYGLRNLKHDLGIKYGKDTYFNDDQLFDDITKLTFPEIREFFKTYVESPNMIPYEKFFDMVGVNFVSHPTPTFGNVQLAPAEGGKISVAATSSLNEFGKKMGYQEGDEFVSVNGSPFDLKSAQQVIQNFNTSVKAGDTIQVVIVRKNESGEKKQITLSAPAQILTQYVLEFNAKANAEQLKLRNAWLGKEASEDDATSSLIEADSADVNSVDAVIKTLYAVISGPAGPRNWERFKSLFYPGAKMAALVRSPQGAEEFQRFTPDEYAKMNDPYFRQFEFIEKELHRATNTYGNISQVFSSYEYNLVMPQQTIKQRGINSIELINENGRWWVTSFTWNDEKPDQPLPENFAGELSKPVPDAKVKTKKKK